MMFFLVEEPDLHALMGPTLLKFRGTPPLLHASVLHVHTQVRSSLEEVLCQLTMADVQKAILDMPKSLGVASGIFDSDCEQQLSISQHKRPPRLQK